MSPPLMSDDVSPVPASVRERPYDELLPDQRPEPREPVRLDDQEEEDERADDHHVQVLDGRRSVLSKQGLQQYVEKIRDFERKRMIARH